MKLPFFVNYCLSLTLFYMWVYYNSSLALNDRIEEQVQIGQLKKEIAALGKKNQFLSYQIQDLAFQLNETSPAQAKRIPASVDLSGLSAQRFETARAAVREGKLDQALLQLREIEKRFPSSSLLPEVGVMAGDILRSQSKLTQAIKQYEMVIELFPDHLQSGIALFRLGEIAEKNSNHREAISYFEIVEKQFQTNAELKSGAHTKLTDLKKKVIEFNE